MPAMVRAIFSSFVGTLGFAYLLQAPVKTAIPASIVGSIAYTVYAVLTMLGIPDPSAIFLGTLVGTILGQILARRMRRISTIFTTLAIVSLVPGLGLYRCMEYLGSDQSGAGVSAGVDAIISILMIVLGIAVGTFLFRMITGNGKHSLPDR